MGLFPPMPPAEWQETKDALASLQSGGGQDPVYQVVGRIRLAASVRRNHWWNAPFHLTAEASTKPAA